MKLMKKNRHRCILLAAFTVCSSLSNVAYSDRGNDRRAFDHIKPNFILFRTKSFGQPYNPEVYIDGESHGVLKRGDNLSLVLSNGKHRVAIKEESSLFFHKYDIQMTVHVEDDRDVYMRLDSYLNGIFTPTRALTDFELIQVEKDVLVRKDDTIESRYLTMSRVP